MDFTIIGQHTLGKLVINLNNWLAMIIWMNKVFIVIVALAFVTCTSLRAQEQLQVFKNMELALMKSNEGLFKAQWHSEGYQKNLVGRSGIPGSDIYRQGSREKWYLKPGKSTEKYKDSDIVTCEVWAWEKEKSLDFVYAAALKINKRWLIIGVGENLDEVKAMVDKFSGLDIPNPNKHK